jgi:hypothetical protein
MSLQLFSYSALAAVAARLQDPNYGYNANVAAYNAVANASAPTVDFNSGTQFFQAYADIGDFEDGTAFAYPLMQAYVISGQNKNEEKFREFAGPVQIGLELWHTFSKEEVDPLLTELTAAVAEAAVFHTFNVHGVNAFIPGCGLLWSGLIKYAKQRLQPYGEGFRLGQVFALTFELRV